MNKLKIVSISAELSPFSKSGGLADVARSLPKALSRLGHEIICITPLYGQVIDKEKYDLKLLYKNVKVSLNSKEEVVVNYWKGYLLKNLPVYFIENTKYFSKKKTLYGSDRENERFLIFDVAALKLISMLKFEADIVHCHDWQTGLIPFYLKTDFRYSKTLRNAKTIFTIHNLIFQLGMNWWEVPIEKKDFGRKKIPHITDPDIKYLNFAKRAILSADMVNTVSEQYREEIITKNIGQDLHRVLKNREDRLFGIVNGIDYKAYNPLEDPGLHKKYDYQKSQNKKENKLFVQEKFGLTIDPDVPLICSTSRVTFQKGFELILKIIWQLMELNLQMIVIGAGDKKYIKELQKVAKKYPNKLAVIPSHEENQKYETLVYAGSDFFLLPSHHEPCGINQLIAMRYGCVPIVRKIGGLNDTVRNFNPTVKRGTGFSFAGFDKFSLYGAIIRALEVYKDKETWKDLVVRGMQESNSWEIPAKKYLALYKKALKLK
ncbi:glycogen synthase [Candidatus Parcubacteria bacterium]|nr:glycogen synthase [Patescibacteria group bacterium]MBU4309860.1 glycogen synthase [Patescibacteria group bacterium]MBU4431729.1 glycogen synthase [Patescibacteria group bacterium]MBU4578199.1 glycogen synthase [Patescibacteria group bacterium]MCG2696735.1 glycogen synthase [Candidatus Parcubacteria bacterium]